jgi:hypothetical protein
MGDMVGLESLCRQPLCSLGGFEGSIVKLVPFLSSASLLFEPVPAIGLELHTFMILLDQSGAAARESKLFPPSRNLALFVEHFWAQQTLSGVIGSSWRVIPEANPNLIFVVWRTDGRCIRTRCCLVGPRSRFGDVVMADRILTCGVRLRPGVLPLLTRFPARDFTDRSVHVEEVFGARGRSLMNKLNECRSAIQAVGALASFLGRELAGPECALPLSQGRCSRVEEMAARAGMPIRSGREGQEGSVKH